ncbi:hypothetical protein Q4534_06490 [Cyclobacterium sp. 1_MG-2023]|uniref:hypothetical protein n=1 Tax=Cyclobacterium sp. 1_MG-2023 TaxID=3062681 RepID=UPI0026E36EEB|nr:hypothetical protein [Cyclobacterium sp. 1_MG-2023]MDO6437044.1 hypothetical protein [Cyclobacterium sp. 1_MG-2023]|tara:strand:+ start:19453 stop:19632 length:180 start_codon:yes stop_codon:yes gene_type:complete
MKSKEGKTMQSLMRKLDRLESEKQVELTHEEARLYQVDSQDELPLEDHLEPANPLDNGS